MIILVYENNTHFNNMIKLSLDYWALNRNITIEDHYFNKTAEIITYFAKGRKADVILINDSMKGINNIKVIEYIRKSELSIPIILIARDNRNAADGYLLGVVGYLEIPIDKDRLAVFLDRIVKQQGYDRIFKLVTEDSIINLRQKNILYVEVNDHTVIYHTMKECIQLRGTLKGTLDDLGNEYFIQIHRSYLIAKDKIYSIKSTYPYSVNILDEGKTINLPVSRKYISKLMEAQVY